MGLSRLKGVPSTGSSSSALASRWPVYTVGAIVASARQSPIRVTALMPALSNASVHSIKHHEIVTFTGYDHSTFQSVFIVM